MATTRCFVNSKLVRRQVSGFNQRHCNGFTLVETLFAIGIFGLVIIAVSKFQRDVFYLSNIAKSSLASAQDTRQIVRTMAKEMRAAAPANNGAYPLVNLGTSTVTFYADTDGDGLREQVRYFVASGILKRGVITPTGTPYAYTGAEKVSILVNDIRNTAASPIFEFYDALYDGSQVALAEPIDVSKVRLVKITLQVDADPSRSPVQKAYTSQVSIRNLKDNL